HMDTLLGLARHCRAPVGCPQGPVPVQPARAVPRIRRIATSGDPLVSERLQALIAAAGSAANARRWQEAERLWSQVRALDPGNVQALFSLGVHAHQRGDARGALDLLEAARAIAPADPMLALTIGRAHV